MKLYHGTSKAAYKAILANDKSIKPSFVSSNVSLGGAYFTTNPELAKVYARRTAREHGEDGNGVVFEVKPIFPLLPDEDWVVNAFEELEINENEEIIDPKYKDFFDDLFIGYDQNSLSDHYKKRYEYLNKKHGITWKDSIRWAKSVRQKEPIVPEQIIRILKESFPMSESNKTWQEVAMQLFPTEFKEFQKLKGRRPDAVAFTTIENDVKRRDLTINALFYDIAKGEVVDFVGGLEDIKKGVVRAVGNPSERFDEDRLRILRVIRFAARMGAGMDEGTENAILQDNSLAGVSAERIRDEFLKSIQSAKSVKALHALYDTFDLWPQVFPGLKINSWYHETKNVPVQLALLLRDNDPQVLAKKLNNLKYSVNEIRQVTFLIMLQELQPETAYQLKKLFVTTGLSEADLEEFATMAGKPDMKLLKAFNKYQPSVKGQELMDLGFKGRELGQELQRRETENFRNLL